MEHYLPIFWSAFLNNSPNLLFLALVAPFVFPYIDRWWGATKPGKRYSKLLLLVTAAVMWAAGGPVPAIGALMWFVYRSMGFNYGKYRTGAPETDEDRKHTLYHHLWMIPLMLVPTVLTPANVSAVLAHNLPNPFALLSIVATVGIFYMYAKAATELAIDYGNLSIKAKSGDADAYNQINAPGEKGYNAKLERTRGKYYGVAYLAWFGVLFLVSLIK